MHLISSFDYCLSKNGCHSNSQHHTKASYYKICVFNSIMVKDFKTNSILEKIILYIERDVRYKLTTKENYLYLSYIL